MSDALFESVLRRLAPALVILIRDQHLTEDEQVRFAERFGPISMSTRGHFQSKNPAIMLISNIREDGKQIGALPDGEMHFHTDQCHQERPAMATMLYSIEVPSVGGNTLFANAYAAYETLPDAIKQKIEGRKALNAYDYDAAATTRGTKLREGVPALLASDRADASGDRTQGAVRQPSDDGRNRGIIGRRRRRRFSTRCSIIRNSGLSSTSTSGVRTTC